jgi:hypothetical protein
MASVGVSSVTIYQDNSAYEFQPPPEAALTGGICQVSDRRSVDEIVSAFERASVSAKRKDQAVSFNVAIDVNLVNGRKERLFMETAIKTGVPIGLIISGVETQTDSSLYLKIYGVAAQKCGNGWQNHRRQNRPR